MQRQIHITLHASRRGFRPVKPAGWTGGSGGLAPGAEVNLEQPMKADGRFGGHIVQGHVDGVGKVIAFERIGDSENWWLHIEIPKDVEKYTCVTVATNGVPSP